MPLSFEDINLRTEPIYHLPEDILPDSDNHFTYTTQYESNPELSQETLEDVIRWFDFNTLSLEEQSKWEIKNEKKETDFSLRNI